MNYPDPKKLMPWEEFVLLNKDKPDFFRHPYIFEIDVHNGKKILYYGAKHSQQPDNPMFKDIRKRFQEFNPDIVFIEGMEQLNTKEGREEAYKIIHKETEEETISKNGGESGFALRLALEKNIDVESPEVSFKKEVEYAESQRFSREEIFIYFATRYICQLQRYPKNVERPSLEKYAQREFNRLKRIVNWEDIQIDLENYIRIFKKVIGRDFNLDDPSLNEVVDPAPWPSKRDEQGPTNEIGRVISNYRDERIMQRITDALNDHHRVFVIYGSGHAIKQEPALKEFFKNH